MIETSIVSDGASSVDVHTNGTVTVVTLDVRNIEALCIDCILSGLTGGTTPTVQFLLDRLAADGSTWVNIDSPTALSADGVVSFIVGPGLPLNTSVGRTVRVRATTTGGPTAALANVGVLGDRYSG